MNIDPLERYYEISIGEEGTGPEGPWWKGLSAEVLDIAKTQVRAEIADLLSGVDVPFALDLDSVLIANGIDPHGSAHVTIPDQVQASVLDGWLEMVRSRIRNRHSLLWLEEVEGNEIPVEIRCCTGSGNNWHACFGMSLLKGSSRDRAEPWNVVVPAADTGLEFDIVIPILITASWRCAMFESMAMTQNGMVTPFKKRPITAHEKPKKTPPKKPGRRAKGSPR